MKLYIVTDGDYSDYHIEACFSTEDKAKDYMEKFECDDYMEFELNPEIRKLKNPLFKVHMEKNGNVLCCDISIPADTWTIHLPESRILIFEHINKLIHECYAKDKKHAIKITNEKRSQLIASGEWERLEKEESERIMMQHGIFFRRQD